MPRFHFVFMSIVAAAIVGCDGNAQGPAVPAGSTVTQSTGAAAETGDKEPAKEPAKDEPSAKADMAEEKTADAKPSKDAKPAAKSAGPSELKLEGISFMVPGTWKRVEPPTSRIVEAEFSLPRVEGDEYDGRLTLMAAGGDNDANIARWTGEFNQVPGQGAKIDTMKVAGVEATTVDIRGEWKGSSFAPSPSPRADYRMLSVILPFSERNSFYIKLTGPKETLARYEEEFRDFVKSAHIKKPR